MKSILFTILIVSATISHVNADNQLNLSEVKNAMQKVFTEAETACDSNKKDGCFMVGMYYSEAGNNAKASEFYEKSCSLGHSRGCLFFANSNHKCNFTSIKQLIF